GLRGGAIDDDNKRSSELPSEIRSGSLLARSLEQPLSVSRRNSKRRRRSLARTLRSLGDGTAPGGPLGTERLADLQLERGSGDQRLPQGEAVAQTQHHSRSRPAGSHPLARCALAGV